MSNSADEVRRIVAQFAPHLPVRRAVREPDRYALMIPKNLRTCIYSEAGPGLSLACFLAFANSSQIPSTNRV
jgi:hypothetical protein